MNDNHIDSINRIVQYLNQQVDATHSLQELADVAQISPFHFHRVYRAITGETPFGTLRRLRIARAATMLLDTNKPITEIAFDVGYESSQAFSRAFRQLAHCSATEARTNRAKLQSLIDKLSGTPGPAGGTGIEVRLVSVEPFKVIASRHAGPPESLFAAFGELFEWAKDNKMLDDYRGIYGIPIDDPRDETEEGARFDCCFDFGPGAKAGKPYSNATLGGGLHAVVRHVGSYDGLDDKYDEVYGSWLPQSGYSLRDSRPYNHYLADPDTVPEPEWETDIYIPVQERA